MATVEAVALSPTHTMGKPTASSIHLIGAELHDRLRGEGHDVVPGAMGENVTTRGIDLPALPTGTLLTLGADAVVEVTGLRNPCGQLRGRRRGGWRPSGPAGPRWTRAGR